MEENLPVEQPETVSAHDCANCGKPALEGDYPTALCKDCRDHFSRLSVPPWIMVFAAGIGVILVFSLFTFPKNIALGVHLERGKNAMEKGNYYTAEKELRKALEKFPDNVEANGNLIIASFYNQDYETMAKLVKKLESVNIEDKALYSHISETLEKADRYFPGDSINAFMKDHPRPADIDDSDWANYLGRNPEDCYAMMTYASAVFDKKDYVRCDSILQRVLKVDDTYFTALLLETSVKRELGDMEASLGYARRILAVNHESAYGMATEARTLLRLKKDQPALELALRANSLRPNVIYIEASLVLAYHFNGRAGDRDALLKSARSQVADSTDREAMQYVQDVMDHKEKFRD
ncbi:MAG TPA: hypothetical protein VKQ52_00325 [Puia sp.]|nr:hypothetical protein [Puia sp.]